MRSLLVALALLTLGACDEAGDSLKIGGKEFTESTILSEMMAALAEEAGIPVVRRTRLGDTEVNLEALRRGDIDLYAEYNGTGLVMLGQPAMADGDEAMAEVRRLYEPLGLSWGQRFGFANNYGLAMRSQRAEELGIATISDLVGQAGSLTAGVDENFRERPVDGFGPMTARYGMSFGNVVVVPPENRVTLYDRLLSGGADVIEVFTTDGQIADLELVLLEDDLNFFPVNQAAPLVRADALTRFPDLRGALDGLAGRIDAPAMQRLNSRVDQDSLAPREVARAALAEMGLIEGTDTLDIATPVIVARSPLMGTEDETGRALRAVRTGYPNRRVLMEPFDSPLAAMSAGEAQVGLVTAAELIELGGDGAAEARPFEGIGVVGQSYVHLIALGDVPAFADLERIATGPVGSASHQAGLVLAAGSDGRIAVEPIGAAEFAADAAQSGAQAALILAPLGSPEVAAALDGGRLMPIEGWGQGNNNLIRYPQLRIARIPSGTYPGQSRPVETLSSQLVLVGPRVADTQATGPQGPGASAPTAVAALTDDTVTAINDALATDVGLDPAVERAAALAPALPEPPAAVNPSFPISMLTLVVLAMFAWLIWLYGRPERR